MRIKYRYSNEVYERSMRTKYSFWIYWCNLFFYSILIIYILLAFLFLHIKLRFFIVFLLVVLLYISFTYHFVNCSCLFINFIVFIRELLLLLLISIVKGLLHVVFCIPGLILCCVGFCRVEYLYRLLNIFIYQANLLDTKTNYRILSWIIIQYYIVLYKSLIE